MVYNIKNTGPQHRRQLITGAGDPNLQAGIDEAYANKFRIKRENCDIETSFNEQFADALRNAISSRDNCDCNK